MTEIMVPSRGRFQIKVASLDFVFESGRVTTKKSLRTQNTDKRQTQGELEVGKFYFQYFRC